MKLIGKKIRGLRRNKNMTQEQLESTGRGNCSRRTDLLLKPITNNEG